MPRPRAVHTLVVPTKQAGSETVATSAPLPARFLDLPIVALQCAGRRDEYTSERRWSWRADTEHVAKERRPPGPCSAILPMRRNDPTVQLRDSLTPHCLVALRE